MCVEEEIRKELDALYSRLAAVEQSVKQHGSGLGRVGIDMTAVEKKISGLEKRIAALETD